MACHHPNGQQVPTREVGGDQEHFRAQDQLMAYTGHATELCSFVLFDYVEEDLTARLPSRHVLPVGEFYPAISWAGSRGSPP